MLDNSAVRLLAASAVAACATIAAAQDYTDSAADAAYDGGWQNADDGGTDLDPWIILPDDGGFGTNLAGTGIADATSIGGDAALNTAGRAFAVHVLHQAGNGAGASVVAIRQWSAPFPVGPQGKIFFDAQPVSTVGSGANGEVSIADNAVRLVRIHSKNTDANWHVVDSADDDTSIPRLDPVRVEYTYVNSTTFDIRVSSLAGPGAFVSTGRTHASAGVPDTFFFESASAGTGSEGYLLVNSIVVDPDASLPVAIDSFSVE